MAEARDIEARDIENTQPRNSAPLLERATEDKCADGVGGTATNHIAEPSDSHKHPGGSSLGKVRVHLILNF
jgi:hypothetical protein